MSVTLGLSAFLSVLCGFSLFTANAIEKNSLRHFNFGHDDCVQSRFRLGYKYRWVSQFVTAF